MTGERFASTVILLGAIGVLVFVPSPAAAPPPCVPLSVVYLNSGEALSVTGCAEVVSCPFDATKNEAWWKLQAADRPASFVVREAQVDAVAVAAPK